MEEFSYEECCNEEPESVLKIGDKLPSMRFICYTPDGETIEKNTDDFRGRFLVIVTFPFCHTKISPSEIIAFGQNINRFIDVGADVISLSSENQHALNVWANTPRNEGGIGNCVFPLGSDISGNIGRKLGFFMEHEGHLLRATMIVDPDGIIKHISMNMPYQARSVEEVLRLVKAFKFAREHGNVCPAQWQEGHETIAPNVSQSKAYFSEKYK